MIVTVLPRPIGVGVGGGEGGGAFKFVPDPAAAGGPTRRVAGSADGWPGRSTRRNPTVALTVPRAPLNLPPESPGSLEVGPTSSESRLSAAARARTESESAAAGPPPARPTRSPTLAAKS
jgi:hypothetical protein